MTSTTPITIHPRRLFCSASPCDGKEEFFQSTVDATSCLKPSVIAHQEKLNSVQRTNVPPLLAPSPKSPAVLRTHVEVGLLREDIELLVDYIKAATRTNRNSIESITLASHNDVSLRHTDESAVNRSLFVSQLEPLKDAIDSLLIEISHQKESACVGVQTEDEETVQSFVETPKHSSSKSINKSGITDSRMLSADMAHLRTIQKEVRGLFMHDKLTIDLPLSPREIGGASSSASSSIDPQTATKISRMLGQSEIGGFSQLTLSPTTEIFEKVKTNPWFRKEGRRRSGSLPNIHDEVVITDSPISTIAPVSAAFTNREILANDDSMTVSALQAAMARRRNGRPPGASDLVHWLRKQAGDNEDSKRRLNNVYRNFPDSSIYRN